MLILRSIAVAMLLTACATGPRCPAIPGGPDYCLQPTGTVPAFMLLQDIHIERGEFDARLIAALEVDDDGMRLVGLTPLGQRVVEAAFDNQTVHARSLANEGVDAKALLALIQITLWPAEQVRAGLPGGWRLDDGPTVRRLVREDGEVVLDITREGSAPNFSRLDIRLPVAGLRLTIRDIDDAAPRSIP